MSIPRLASDRRAGRADRRCGAGGAGRRCGRPEHAAETAELAEQAGILEPAVKVDTAIGQHDAETGELAEQAGILELEVKDAMIGQSDVGAPVQECPQADNKSDQYRSGPHRTAINPRSCALPRFRRGSCWR